MATAEPTDAPLDRRLRALSALDDTILRRRLEHADVAVLAATVTHLTGSDRWLTDAQVDACRAIRRPSAPAIDADVRRQILDAAHRQLAALRDGTMAVCARPSDEMLLRAISIASAVPDPQQYLPKLLADLHLDERGHRRLIDPRAAAGVRVVVIGAGLSGLCMARQLHAAGFQYRVLEKNPAVGGTWFENRYPDCGVDTNAHLYCYTDAPNPTWSRHMAKREEILGYINRYVDEAEITPHIMFDTEVHTAVYDSEAHEWTLQIEHGDGRSRVLVADVVVSAVGSLNRPQVPDIPGLDSFAGQAFHTARWPADVELSDRRIGLVGNGSSGVQVGPRLAELAAHLTHFQRSPHWIAPNPLAEAETGKGMQWLIASLPFYGEWYRFMLYASGDQAHRYLVRDPTWSGPGISARNERLRARLISYIEAEVGHRPDLVRKLIPRYPPYGKRMVLDSGWYRALTRPNVDLVTEPVDRATRTGLITVDGRHHDLDIVVFATGFQNARFLWPMEVRGRSGQTPAEAAGSDDDLRAYLGITMPDFPNFFMIMGPNSSHGHGGSSIFIAEAQGHYIMECLNYMVANDIASIECQYDSFQVYNTKLDHGLEAMVWSEPGLTSRYRNRAGRVATNHPWTLQDYWLMTREPDWGCFKFEPGRIGRHAGVTFSDVQ